MLDDILIPNPEKNSPMFVVVLDEIDYLISKGQDILYKLFEYPRLENSRLVLIGIANALDLTKRILPRLAAKNCLCDLFLIGLGEPQLLNFNPYEIREITDIIKERLESSNQEGRSPLMANSAIEFCARKIVGTGDLRKALVFHLFYNTRMYAVNLSKLSNANKRKPQNPPTHPA
jgi:cell division control protein 6